MTDSMVLCADIGGSHITAAMVDLGTRKVLSETAIRQSVKSDSAVENIISDWCAVLSGILQQQALEAEHLTIGIAMPGPFDYERGISYIKGLGKYEALYGLNVKDLIAKKLGIASRQVRLKNDAGCFLHGEVLAGAAQQFEHVIGLTLGTGIGTARYHAGTAEDADLWRLPYRDSFIEEYLATRWFLKRYNELTGKNAHDVKALVSIYNTDPVVKEIFDEFADHLTEFLVEFIRMDNPEIIVMGGNISNAYAFFLPRVIKNLNQRSIDVPIKRAMLGEHAAMLGVATCWSEKIHSSVH
jgi:glucokinase